MLKKITFLFFILLSVIVNAQNWQVVHLGENKFFTKNGYPLQATRVDSATLSGTDSLFYNFFTHDEYTGGGCIDTLAPSWIGRKILLENSGRNVFFNINNDSIFIQTHASLGFSWHLYDFPSGDYFQATVSYSGIQFIGAVSDSVKEISIVRKNATGVIVSDFFNGKKITISKNNGIVALFGMRYFPQVFFLPADTINYVYNPAVHLLTRAEIYDYNVGDEIAYQYSCGGAPGCIMLRKVLDKWYSTASDTVFYRLQYVTQCTTIVPPPPSPYGLAYTTTTDTQVVFYTNLADKLFLKMPSEYTIFPGNVLANVEHYSIDNSYCGRDMYRSISTQYYFDGTCYLPAFEPHVIYNVYINGFGGPFMEQDNDLSGPGFCSGQILYMNKAGIDTCGTAPVFVGIQELAANKMSVSLFPNPCQEKFTLSLSTQNNLEKRTDVQIFALDGRIVKTVEIQPSSTNLIQVEIVVSELTNGLYFLKAGEQTIKIAISK